MAYKPATDDLMGDLFGHSGSSNDVWLNLLSQSFDYDSVNGVLYRRFDGTKSKTIIQGKGVYIGIFNYQRKFGKLKICWYLHTGRFVRRPYRVYAKDHNPNNIKFDNLYVANACDWMTKHCKNDSRKLKRQKPVAQNKQWLYYN